MESHAFSVAHAKKYGVECAILLNFFIYWIRINKALGKNFREEKTWVYHSQRELSAIYPYWSCKTIERHLAKLIDYGVLIKNKFNNNRWKQTNWYAFYDESEFLCEDSKNVAHTTKVSHRMVKSVASIDTHEYKTIKEQQAEEGAIAPAAASFGLQPNSKVKQASKSDPPKKKELTPDPETMKALEASPLNKSTKTWALTHFDKESILQALNICAERKDIEDWNPYFKEAIKGRWWEEEKKLTNGISREGANKTYAMKYQFLTSSSSEIMCWDEYVVISGLRSSYSQSFNYSDKSFMEKFKSEIRKRDFLVLEE